MLLAASDAIGFASGLDEAGFIASDLHQSAILRKLEIIGEAAGQVSNAFQQQHPEIPWSGMISLRNRLIHGYRVVQLDIVWRVVQRDLPPLIETLRPLIPPEDEFTS
ncbi:DUF86 domain-containing protein [Thiocystis minor]|uniref:HepT-like ribonuclease domain-containing protein n=1 Tax=Thiocystis minor TaxID=61597 RepID=UPI001F5D004D|nr:DUF86 domain-containing protein [Thiocystis minor]